MSEPTKEALKIAHEYMSDCPDDVDMARLALAIDAHTQVLRTENAKLLAENDRWKEIVTEELACTMQMTDALGCAEAVKNGKAVMDAQLEAIAQLRERLRLAVEARKAWKYAALLSPPPLHGAAEKLAREADAACRAAGVEVEGA